MPTLDVMAIGDKLHIIHFSYFYCHNILRISFLDKTITSIRKFNIFF